jgi:DNA-binding NarL/FixJ family response regulator
MIDLMLVDDHPMWRNTLKRLLHSRVGTVVAEAQDGTEALERASETALDLVIMDINLPSMDGIEATRRLIAAHPDLKVLVLASSDERTQVMDSVRAGASGYLLKTAAPEEVLDAVRRVSRGELVFPPKLTSMVLDELRRAETESGAYLRVMIADEEILPREGLTRLLKESGIEVVAGMSTGDELLALMESDEPDVVIIEAALATADHLGTSLAENLRIRFPGVGLLVLSSDPAAAQAVSVLSASGGGIGYLFKKRITNIEEVTDAIQRVAEGETVVDPQVVSGLVEQPKKAEQLEELTDREQEVLAMMAEGHSNQAIAERLFLGPKTVETHVRRIFTKLGLEPAADVHRRVLAVIAYLRST